MVEILPAWPLLAAFLLASLILAVTPGPGVLYIVSRSLLDGRRHGLVSVAGVALGNLGNALGACLGLATLFAISSTAFLLVKYAGALYLLYLGLRALFAARPENTAPQGAAHGLWRSFRDGGIVALLNPKTALFFAAFLPQFMDSQTTPLLQGMTLGALFVAIAALTDSVYALAAGSAAATFARLRGSVNAGRYLKGGVFIGLGFFTALAGTRTR